MPGADAKVAAPMVDTINELLKINNQFYSSAPLKASCGMATSQDGETVESVIKRADMLMYEHKRAYYEESGSEKLASITRKVTSY
jgi:PleD family two-component response regulator